MGGSSLGVWVAHGEGKLVFPDNKIHEEVKEQNLVPLVYATPDGAPTIQYPYNPNGSRDGYAGLCSKDGRHTATMPHPERCVSLYNWPWMPQKWRSSMQASPWLKMFQNARQWCVENPR
jgi:phosphoribosylformylglycinamidine synthase